jgi:hypothetical protein
MLILLPDHYPSTEHGGFSTSNIEEASMSLQANSYFVVPYHAEVVRCFRRIREFMSKVLLCHAIKPCGRPKKGKSGVILQIPC